MANNFQITISAIDKATAVVRKVNDSVSRAVRPLTEIKRASVALSKEVGLDRMGKSLGNVGKAAADVSKKVSGIIAPLAAVVGVGSIAAIGEMAKKWGEFGAEISRTSANIGVSTGELQALRGAAQLSGVSAESLTGGLKSLGDTMEDALYGRNQSALMMMNRLGITMKHTSDGAVDTTAAFSDLAESISRIKNPQVQGLVARTFGLEAVLPLLRKGKAGIAELNQKMRESGAIMSGPQIAAANGFQQSMAFLDIAMNGLKNTIGSALIPIMQPMIDKITAWTIANKEMIATKFAEVAKGIADAVSSIDWKSVVAGVESFLGGIKDVVDCMGGWKNAIIGLVVIMNGSLIASVLNLGLALGKLAFTGFPFVIRAVGGLVGLLPGLFLKLAMLTETVLPALSGAFVAMGAAIEATPIGLIITAIAGIGIAGYELVKHWDDIKRWWHRLWGDMSDDASSGSANINFATKNAAPYQPGGASGSWDDDTPSAAHPAPAKSGLLGLVRKLENSGSANINFATKNAAPYQPRGASGSCDDEAPAAARAAPAKPGLLGLVRKLENSGDSAVSKAGAIGRYQIMPNTARQYGFDPSRLTDPAYNENVASAVLSDLQKRYGNDNDAILAAYNGGPGRANQFLAAGRNPAVLPRETQNYLAHSHQLLAQSGPAVATPYVAAPPQSQLEQMAEQMGITTIPAHANQTTVQSSPMQPGNHGAVTVEISFANAPQGMKTRTHTTGGVVVNTKISHAMPVIA